MALPSLPTPAALVRERIAALRAEAEGESLHDFRVALRRLRSMIRVHDALADEPLPRALTAELRRIARSTNASRDREVVEEWLARCRGAGVPKVPRSRGAGVPRSRGAEVRRYRGAEVLRELEAALGREEPTGQEPPGPALARELRRLTLALRRRLAVVRSAEQHAEAHAARIAGKRVRYLLESLAPALPGAAALVEEFKLFQDCLGELHDADLAEEFVRRRRIRGVRKALEQRQAKAWRAVRREWLTGAERRLVTPALGLADRLRELGAGNIEIERKYLLTGVPPRAREVAPLEVEQGYLPGEKIRERVRRVRGPDGTRCFRTAKFGVGVSRQEYEDEIPESLFNGLWPLTEGRRVVKRRYPVPEGELTWEIDEFPALGLVLAEVELPSAEMTPEPPGWLQPCMVREVTGEPEYLNSSLAR